MAVSSFYLFEVLSDILDLSVLLLLLDPVTQVGGLSHQLVGLASLAQPLGPFVSQGEKALVLLLDLGLSKRKKKTK